MPSLLSGMNLLVIIFPIQCDSKGSSKTGTRQSHGGSGNPQMANSGVVVNGYESADKLPSPSAAQCQTTYVTQPLAERTSITQETGPSQICHLSGNSCMQTAFYKQLQICVPGETGQKSNTGRIFPSGKITATPKGSVQFQLL